MENREYQQEAVAAVLARLKTHNDALLVLSCGLGKTECAFLIMKHFPGNIMIALHRVKLTEQTVRRARAFLGDAEVGEVCASRGECDSEKRITVGSIQSLAKLNKKIDLLIVDEAHRLTTHEDSSYLRLINNLRSENPGMKILGLTATPWRASGKIYGEKKSLFSEITYQKNLKWAVENGFLVTPRMKKPEEQFDLSGVPMLAGDYHQEELEKRVLDNPKVKLQVTDALGRLKDRKKIAWACVSIKHAELVHGLIPEKASIVHSKMGPLEQQYQVESFEKGDTRHMVFVTILSEGYDYPPVDGIVFMRPTKSPVLYVQTAGRGLRLSPGKQDCLILDYGRVVENCGPLDNPRIPGERKGSKSVVPPTKFCPQCLEYLDIKIEKCPACGFEFPRPKLDPTKNLTVRAADGNILSVAEEWLPIRDVQITPYKVSSGRLCIAVTYVQQSWLRLPVREYCVFDDSKAWMNKSSAIKLAKFGLTIRNEHEAEAWINNNYKLRPAKLPKKIKIKNGQFPEVLELSYE